MREVQSRHDVDQLREETEGVLAIRASLKTL